ncbi:MAG: DUF4040 domain-containing protein [Chloroflexi bacterium]|nr:DUF4040 domain-containing protein [Chloroflexota bacterium]
MAVVALAAFQPFFAAALAVYLGPRLRGRAGWWAAGSALISLLLMATFLPAVSGGARFFWSVSWVPDLGVNASFLVDGVSLMFALIIAGIGLLIFLYSIYYFDGEENHGRFYALMLLFMGSMLGTVLSSNLLFLFLFWELTSLSSFFLIGFWPEREESRSAATQALLVTALGGLAMLTGFILLYLVSGTFELAELGDKSEQIQASPLYLPILLLVLAGAFSKSAQFPFHFWLPNAMVAPTPVSAYLHSAAMVKAGIFLIARFYPFLSGTQEWFYLVAGAGLVTMLWGGYQAMRQMELKALLAYSTISQLGLIVAGFGLGTEAGVVAATFQIINHAVFKSALFMIAGIVHHVTGAREINKLGGLARRTPLTAIVAAVAVLSLAGVPPLGGFLSKELFLEATGEVAGAVSLPWVLPLAATLGAILTVVYSLKFYVGTFHGPAGETNGDVTDPSRRFLFAPAFLAATCLFIGIVPVVISEAVLMPASATILGHAVDLDIQLWNGISLPLLMSVVAITVGILGYRKVRHALWSEEMAPFRVGPEQVYQACFTFLTEGTSRIFYRLQSGYLRRYLLVIVCIPVVLATSTFFAKVTLEPLNLDLGSLQPYDYAIAIFFVAATLATAVQEDRLGAILAMGVVGSLASLTYVLYSAPDLALTQLLIEVLSVVLFALVFVYMLPFSKAQVRKAFVARDVVIAGAVGVLVTTLMLTITSYPAYSSIRDFYVQASETLAGGKNVVNVIIVDFRGYDTMGEIVVLSISAIALFSLVKFGKGRSVS